MSGKKKSSKKDKTSEVNEPAISYGKRTIHVFKSFAEEEQFKLKKMAAMTPEQLMDTLEAMRRFFLKEHLLADGKWKPLERIITIRKPFIE